MQDDNAPLLIAKGFYQNNHTQIGIHYYVGEMYQEEDTWFWKIRKAAHMLDRAIELAQEMVTSKKRRVFFSLQAFPMGSYINGDIPHFTDVTDAVTNYKSK